MSIETNSYVLNWLNDDLNIKPKIINISKEFQNGYKFGELLFNLKLISSED